MRISGSNSMRSGHFSEVKLFLFEVYKPIEGEPKEGILANSCFDHPRHPRFQSVQSGKERHVKDIKLPPTPSRPFSQL